jgi:hypothetical protein
MVQIYNEITIYFYKAIFYFFAPEPPLGALLPPNPLVGGVDPAEGVPPLCTPPRGRVYILLGCKYFMGYKHG